MGRGLKQKRGGGRLWLSKSKAVLVRSGVVRVDVCSGCLRAESVVLFFFSSRRRHTRYWRDWSSDVCSSDLVTALSIMGLIPRPPARIVEGSVTFQGRDLSKLDDDELADVRGREIAMIFQDPMTSLNPTMRIGTQITETLLRHLDMEKRAARRRAIELLEEVHIPRAADRVDDYPHRFSGGMRQRVMIAIALACRPKLVIADEPTTALDVTVQAGILDLLEELRESHGMAMILITHDMGVVAEAADEV